MRKFALAASVVLVLAGCQTARTNKPGVGDDHVFIPGIEAEFPVKLTGDQALARLQEGSARFAAGTGGSAGVDASRSLARVKQTGTEGQKPFATILTCADSRTAPELFFDQGLGDLFVVRVAGNVTDTMGLASIEYSVDHLGVPLIVVVGHTRCGAVDAAVKTADSPTFVREPHHDPGHFDGNLTALVYAIIPAVEDAQRSGVVPLLNAAIRQNVLQSMRELSSRSVELAREIEAGDVKVMGAIYDVDKGTIEWIAPPAK